MAKYAPLYQPPIFNEDDPHEVRERLLYHSDDIRMFAHIGHYVSWYAIAEFFITMILWALTGELTPEDFHLLTRGMDAKVKIERVESFCKRQEIVLGPALKKRLDHFQKTHAPIRNKIVHSYLYWPEGDALQVASIGALPAIEGFEQFGPPPELIPGLVLFERAMWLNQFSQDVMRVAQTLAAVGSPPAGGTIEIIHPVSGLPTGAQGHPTPPTPRANPSKRARRRQHTSR